MSHVTAWLDALHARHVAPYRPQEFTRALRALSARYVERRSELAERSALDSAGKRSAFAAFYAPLHYLTVREIVRALPDSARQITHLTDLGCGTGVGAAAWQGAWESQDVRDLQDRRETQGALEKHGAQEARLRSVQIVGVDQSQWALEEAKWNWRTLGLGGNAKRGDLVAEVTTASAGHSASPAGLVGPAGRASARPAWLLAWSVNELPREAQTRLLPLLLDHARAHGHVLIVEPLARGAAPWWDDWTADFGPLGARIDEWKFRVDLPPLLKELSSRAGFNREYLGARSIYL